MQFASFAGFLSMGGYGLYVWSSYLAFAVFLIANLIFPLLERRRVRKNTIRYLENNPPETRNTKD
ncbi:MAG: heme exporter protein CcmD [SAR86 cluster bacterium]|uniref:Heme exporter protein D n=1 Tax=SAR86 cluster bacterium TaxID=2030880 RepID=A0A2A4MRD0_9GAMM|nr:MAG: heme exporter protein CcmD [SAR86 cluster bacterium]